MSIGPSSERELDEPDDTLSVVKAQADLAILEKRYPDHANEIEPYLAKGRNLIAKLLPQPEPQQPHQESQWFAANGDFSACNPSRSPADRMQEIRDAGGQPETKEQTDDQGNLTSVEVSVSDGLQDRYWTYYKNKDDCDAAVSAKNEIPDQYR